MTHTILLFALMGCEPMPSSGNPFKPAKVTATSSTANVADLGPSAFDFEGEDRPDEDPSAIGDEDIDELALQAKMLGIDASKLTAPPAPVPVAPVAAVSPTHGHPRPEMLWDPTQPLPDGQNWGVRLLGTLTELQPPRAILGLTDGSEIVAEPGDLLPEHGLVIIAVGRDVVQVAEVHKRGFYASIETKTLTSLFPTRPVVPTE